MLFTDTVTVYNKISDSEWKSTVVNGVQWVEKTERVINDKVIDYITHASVTFPEGTFEDVVLNSSNEEDIIVYGAINDVVDGTRGSRVSDIVSKYPKSGYIKAVHDNSKRDFLKNIKVVVQ